MSGKLGIKFMTSMSKSFTDKLASILVTGVDGFIGAAIAKQLEKAGYEHIRTDTLMDVRNQSSVNAFFEKEKPEYVFLTTPKNIGSPLYAHKKADFIQDHLMMQTNVMHAAHLHGVKKCMFVGSPYVYPSSFSQPVKASDMLSAKMNSYLESFGLIDILGVKMGQAYHFQYETCYMSVIPPHVYGPGMKMEGSEIEVLPFLMQQIVKAKQRNKSNLALPGSGTAVNEFLYVDDLANACLFLMEHHDEGEIVNVGSGFNASTEYLANCIAEAIGYDGKIGFDASSTKDGAGLMLDSSKLISMGWNATTNLEMGIRQMFADDPIF
jgi:GDP-L-fucose synthase